MDNLEYLEKNRIFKFDDELKAIESENFVISKSKIELRKLYALEIIAEELCKFNAREDNRYGSEDCEQSHDHTG